MMLRMNFSLRGTKPNSPARIYNPRVSGPPPAGSVSFQASPGLDTVALWLVLAHFDGIPTLAQFIP